jgi:hypothetical protein
VDTTQARTLGAVALGVSTAACALIGGIEEKVLVAGDGGNAASSAATSAAGGDGGGGGGGSGGTAAETWEEPSCTTIAGTAGVTFQRDGDLANREETLPENWITRGLATLDVPNLLVSDQSGVVFESRDAGCTWQQIGTSGGSSAELVAAAGGIAYGWVQGPAETSILYRYDAHALGDRGGVLSLPLPDPLEGRLAVHVIGFHAYSSSGLRMVDTEGNVFSSYDGGASWFAEDLGLNFACPAVICQRAAFHRNDGAHFFIGGVHGSSYVRPDGAGGLEMGLSEGLLEVSVSAAAYAPASTEVLWVVGRALENNLQGLYLSMDGGRTFTLVAPRGALVQFDDRAPVFPDREIATNVRFTKGVEAAGTDVFRVDGPRPFVGTFHVPVDAIFAIVQSPANPDLLYLGLSDTVF